MKHANLIAGVLLLILSALIVGSILAARKGRELFIRRIAGVDAINEAVGRATEMGRPVFFSVGLGGIDIVTLQAFSIIGQVARLTAQFGSRLIVPVADPLAIPVLEELVREACNEAGRPEAFNSDDIRFLSDQQFAFAAGCVGIMYRERPAANLLFGTFAAESLILAETGQHIQALQVGGTPSQLQTPFFIATCDYVVIGEEYYATSAYLTREPVLLGSLVGQDRSKILFLSLVLAGVLLVSLIKPLIPSRTPNLLPASVYEALPIAEVPFQLRPGQLRTIDDLNLKTIGSDSVKKATAQLNDPKLPAEAKPGLQAQIASAQKAFDGGMSRILTAEQRQFKEKAVAAYQEVHSEIERVFSGRTQAARAKVDDASRRALGASLNAARQRIESRRPSAEAQRAMESAEQELEAAQSARALLADEADEALKARYERAFDQLLTARQKSAMSRGQRRYWIQKIMEMIEGS